MYEEEEIYVFGEADREIEGYKRAGLSTQADVIIEAKEHIQFMRSQGII